MLFWINGSGASGTGNVSPAMPTGWASGDLLVLQAESATGQDVAAPDGTWTQKGSDQDDTTTTRMSVFWKRAGPTEVAPVLVDPGDHIIAGLWCLKGAVATGDPFESVASSTDTTAATSITFPSVTPSAAGMGILNLYSDGRDSPTSAITSFSIPHSDPATLNDLSQQVPSTQGNGGRLAALWGLADSSAAIATTAVSGTGDRRNLMSLVVIPAVDANLRMYNQQVITVLEQEPGTRFISMDSMQLITVLMVGEEANRRRNFMNFSP